MSEGTDPAAAGLHVRGDVSKMTEWGCSAAQRPGKSHHISPQTKRSSGIHFHSSDSLSCTNLIFVCQLQAKWSPRPSAHSGIAIQQPSTHTNYSTLLRPLSDLPTAHSPLRKHNRVVEKHGPGTGLDKSYRGTDWDWACEERKWRAGGGLVLHCDLHWSQIWDAILGDKGKAPGMLVWRRGNRERFQKDEVSRRARVWRCGFAEN